MRSNGATRQVNYDLKIFLQLWKQRGALVDMIPKNAFITVDIVNFPFLKFATTRQNNLSFILALKTASNMYKLLQWPGLI